MKTIDDLLNNLPDNNDIKPGIDNETFKVTFNANNVSTIDLVKGLQYDYMKTMHDLHVELQKQVGISKFREDEEIVKDS